MFFLGADSVLKKNNAIILTKGLYMPPFCVLKREIEPTEKKPGAASDRSDPPRITKSKREEPTDETTDGKPRADALEIRQPTTEKRRRETMKKETTTTAEGNPGEEIKEEEKQQAKTDAEKIPKEFINERDFKIQKYAGYKMLRADYKFEMLHSCYHLFKRLFKHRPDNFLLSKFKIYAEDGKIFIEFPRRYASELYDFYITSVTEKNEKMELIREELLNE